MHGRRLRTFLKRPARAARQTLLRRHRIIAMLQASDLTAMRLAYVAITSRSHVVFTVPLSRRARLVSVKNGDSQACISVQRSDSLLGRVDLLARERSQTSPQVLLERAKTDTREKGTPLPRGTTGTSRIVSASTAAITRVIFEAIFDQELVEDHRQRFDGEVGLDLAQRQRLGRQDALSNVFVRVDQGSLGDGDLRREDRPPVLPLAKVHKPVILPVSEHTDVVMDDCPDVPLCVAVARK
mmetsp:Transcript_30232/g.56472  ORF Transcript_30232/g.56472 Transcript_30232/m.56472 type:complete len:240 (+) Transcript_30232:164-883(+)